MHMLPAPVSSHFLEPCRNPHISIQCCAIQVHLGSTLYSLGRYPDRSLMAGNAYPSMCHTPNKRMTVTVCFLQSGAAGSGQAPAQWSPPAVQNWQASPSPNWQQSPDAGSWWQSPPPNGRAWSPASFGRRLLGESASSHRHPVCVLLPLLPSSVQNEIA